MKAILLAVLLAVPVFAQHGREMTEEEKREMREWVERGSPEEKSAGYHYERRTDWEAVARNPSTWLLIIIIVICVCGWRALNGIQDGVDQLDRNNKRMRRSLEEEHDRLIEEEERSGKPFTFENPDNARWWEEEKRHRRRR